METTRFTAWVQTGKHGHFRPHHRAPHTWGWPRIAWPQVSVSVAGLGVIVLLAITLVR